MGKSLALLFYLFLWMPPDWVNSQCPLVVHYRGPFCYQTWLGFSVWFLYLCRSKHPRQKKTTLELNNNLTLYLQCVATFSQGNLAQRCGRSTYVNSLAAAGLRLAALDATGCWWHTCWLSDIERRGVQAGLISASCGQQFDGQPPWERLASTVLCLLAALTCHVIPICSYSPVTLKRAYTHTHPQRF